MALLGNSCHIFAVVLVLITRTDATSPAFGIQHPAPHFGGRWGGEWYIMSEILDISVQGDLITSL